MNSPGIIKRALTCIEEFRLPSNFTRFLSKLESGLEIAGKRVVFCGSGRRKILFFRINDIPGSDFMLRHVCYMKEHFPKINSWLDFKINTYDTVIDIGAHVGFFSVYAANIAKEGKVYAIEPSSGSFERLGYHRKINRLKNITLINKGISDKKEKARLYLWKKLSQRNSLVFTSGGGDEDYEEIECVTLRDIFDEYGIKKCSFLKIDCEGLEYRILRALPEECFEKIEKIALEYHANGDILEIARLLDKRHYKVVIIGYPAKDGSLFAVKV